MDHAARHVAPRRSVAAWWTSSIKRPALLRALIVTNLVIGMGGVGALVVHEPAALSVGALPPGGLPVRAPRPPQPDPDTISVPSVGVNSRLVPLGISAAGVLDVPKDYKLAGWWSSGPKPGADGAAIVVGHVDSKTGPAVFYKIKQTKVGDVINVHRADGSTVAFVVDAVRQYSKQSLPTNVVYGPTPTPSIRLITCGGSFDPKAKSYRDNIVVFAHLQSEHKSVAV